ncbi:hypothetical protein KC19_1G325600 [Ceratodon purpureus]|uniref:Uncharacterized protein n=1 Tax=Ceratodon purpureus TaxID=3225 RepID=A0A8T0JBU5_CERPU|nr:hypothetical protein KC19_1G325600 [Ceratodon purpureus]
MGAAVSRVQSRARTPVRHPHPARQTRHGLRLKPGGPTRSRFPPGPSQRDSLVASPVLSSGDPKHSVSSRIGPKELTTYSLTHSLTHSLTQTNCSRERSDLTPIHSNIASASLLVSRCGVECGRVVSWN